MTDKQIIIKEITECGFYCSKDDTERLYIYEVIKNTDEEWLKKNPEATLLIDEWLYDYTDYDDRKVYGTSGNLIDVCDASICEVYKIEDTKYKIYGNCGQFLIEDKPTYKEQLKRKEQECEELKIYIESNEQQVKEVETLVMDNDRLINELDQLKAEVKSKTEYIQEQRNIINQYSKEIEMYKKCQGKRASKREEELKAERDSYIDKYFLESQKVVNLRKILNKIKEICNNNDELKGDFNLVDCDKYKLGKHNLANRILQKISECEGNDEKR